MATAASNKYKVEVASAAVNFTSDTFKIILMQSGFSFNKATHGTYADVSASELAAGSGYTAGGATLSGVSVTQNDDDGQADITWGNPSWLASGGSLVTSGAIIYDDTHASKVIIGYIDFAGDQTTLDGGTFTIASVKHIIA